VLAVVDPPRGLSGALRVISRSEKTRVDAPSVHVRLDHRCCRPFWNGTRLHGRVSSLPVSLVLSIAKISSNAKRWAVAIRPSPMARGQRVPNMLRLPQEQRRSSRIMMSRAAMPPQPSSRASGARAVRASPDCRPAVRHTRATRIPRQAASSGVRPVARSVGTCPGAPCFRSSKPTAL
jgi:hypothetical protein